MSQLFDLLASFIAVAVVLTLHEFAHAFVAYKCGDPTAKWSGRMTLNPLKHFDLTGILCFALVGFGWAKPVPINPNNFKKYRAGCVWTSIAGILMNFLTAFLFFPIYQLLWRAYIAAPNFFLDFLWYVGYLLFAYSLSFCVFNLLPFYPLDGFRVIEAVDKRRGKVYRFLRNYGYYILLFLIVESFICDFFVRLGVYQMGYFDILGYVMQFATKYVGWPITALWGLVF